MRPNELVAGNCYFRVAYYDNDLLLPIVETLIYVGFKVFPEDGETWLFKGQSHHPIRNTRTRRRSQNRCSRCRTTSSMACWTSRA